VSFEQRVIEGAEYDKLRFRRGIARVNLDSLRLSLQVLANEPRGNKLPD
jgi:hypothetical protein